MLQIILLAIAALIVLFLAVAAMRPSDFRVERSILIDAPPAAAFAQVQDFHRWPQWSPFENVDPHLRRSYEGAASGEGAIYAWVGNKDVGEGRMLILETRPDQYIKIQLDFLKPFEAHNLAEFTFTPVGARTEVTWAMSGRHNFLFKAIGIFMSMDKMVGGMFEKGLRDLKRLSENSFAQ
ncbi:SRPBCC family protein [Lysobacter gummosus]|uniref:SRPBCC family protein n=1 Tax=Lysobacter gummosus TaxID=262324 RepID=A0ABY3XBD4_9GAMM|nr:SRPBCC family protein [Lysobacter gummosus]ALN93259.1 polyketide cyclase / dehydrase and lipid transport family protein [Lysobacter gummosus]UNP28751.1 SRPBCC family protein [Lysobacter gummosus]